MKYVILSFFILIGCDSSKKPPNPERWTVLNDCKQLAELLKGNMFKVDEYYSKYYDDEISECRIYFSNGDMSNYHRNGAGDSVRAIKNYINRDLRKTKDQCYEKMKCKYFNFERQVDCMDKCKKKIGWIY